jgi:formate dehydrogenase gamma subunit
MVAAVGLLGAGPTAVFADDEECLGCHAVEEDVVEASLQVEVAAWESSIHAEMDFGCADCHEGKSEFPHEEDVPPARCADCHDDARETFAASVHGDECCAGSKDLSPGTATSPFPEGDPCIVCHGVHDVRAVDDPASPSYYRNIPETCAQCHANTKVVQEQGLPVDIVDHYVHSTHGSHLADGDSKPAVCSDCHGAHDVLHPNDPESSIFPFRIAETCGQCHPTESEEYLSSVHGEAFMKGRPLAPNCTGCHGIHTIKLVKSEPRAGEDPRRVRTTCPACHGSEALMTEFGVAPARVSSYRASYHGLANQRGNTAVGDCASCHGIHNIYRSSDPRSTVAPENLQETCGHCHPGASEQFVKSPVHYDATLAATTPLEVTITEWVKKIYWALILVVLGGMVIHNLVIMGYYVRKKLHREREMVGRARFSRSQVLQHGALVISFVVLVISGFMLAYPDTWWSKGLVDLGVSESIRRWTHRVAAVAMILASFYHVYWMLFTSYGQAEIKRIAPRARDARELLQNMKFHLGLSRHQAAFAKYDYPAKAEYWALVWGTVVMAVTGLILWFSVVAVSLKKKWVVKVSEVIHLFEAWLATLAILIFHFFYVIFHPEVYPISLSMFRGAMPAEMAEHHHPAWDPEQDADAESVRALLEDSKRRDQEEPIRS